MVWYGMVIYSKYSIYIERERGEESTEESTRKNARKKEEKRKKAKKKRQRNIYFIIF